MDWTEEELDEVGRLIIVGLPRKAVAQRYGLTETELNEQCDAGRLPGATEAQQQLEHRVRVGEVTCQENLVNQVKSGRNWQGAMRLLETRFKSIWGKEAAPERSAVPEDSVDFDKELDEQLQEKDGPLIEFLVARGWKPPEGA